VERAPEGDPLTSAMSSGALAPAQLDAIELVAETLLNSESDGQVDDFYSSLCEAICRLTSMTRAVIFRYDSARRRVRAAGAYGVDLSVFAGAFVTVESAPLARQALAEDRVIERSEDLEHLLPASYVRLLGPTTVVCSPMTARGRWIGVIVADRGQREAPLDDAERDLLWVLGKTTALAAMARVATRQHEKARALERRIDLARSIHQSVIQRLFGVSMALSADADLGREDRARISSEIQTALAELRNALQQPLGRNASGTQTTLAEEIERLTRMHPDLGVTVAHDGTIDVPARLESLAQSVLAEAVRNAHKHARPTRVSVAASTEAGTFVLEVTNDGVTRSITPSGVGLRLTALEALQAGGLLEFGPRAGHTWQVRLVVPVHEASGPVG
jgi:signal transduction histidine kinase